MSLIDKLEADATKYGPTALAIFTGVAAVFGFGGPAEQAAITALKTLLAGIAAGDSPDAIQAEAAKVPALVRINDDAVDALAAAKWGKP